MSGMFDKSDTSEFKEQKDLTIPSDLRKRRGAIVVSDDMLRDGMGALLSVFQDVLVIRTEHDYFRHQIVMMGYSKHFEPLEDQAGAKEYVPVVTPKFNDAGDVTWYSVKWSPGVTI